MTVVVRHAVHKDILQILTLANQLSDAVRVSESYLQTNFSRFLENEQHCILVAVENNDLIGYVSGYFHEAIYASGKVAYVDEIVVGITERNRNIGTKLMTCFEDVARENDCLIVSLATHGARKFYETLGYHSRAGYYKKYLV